MDFGLALARGSVLDGVADVGSGVQSALDVQARRLEALEGALILARAHRSIEPLDDVERFFASRAPDPRASEVAPL